MSAINTKSVGGNIIFSESAVSDDFHFQMNLGCPLQPRSKRIEFFALLKKIFTHLFSPTATIETNRYF